MQEYGYDQRVFLTMNIAEYQYYSLHFQKAKNIDSLASRPHFSRAIIAAILDPYHQILYVFYITLKFI